MGLSRDDGRVRAVMFWGEGVISPAVRPNAKRDVLTHKRTRRGDQAVDDVPARFAGATYDNYVHNCWKKWKSDKLSRNKILRFARETGTRKLPCKCR